MRTYKFGTTKSWLDNRNPTPDLWQAYTSHHRPDEVIFIYEDGELIHTIECSNMWDRWNKSPEHEPREDGLVQQRFVQFLNRYINEQLK
jgi:hypothetical protein